MTPTVRADRTGLAVAMVGLTALWFFCRPYPGILYDAHIYMERALGNLDPAGLGRQFDLTHDGQTGFSLFPPILTWAVRLWGPGPAAMAIAGTGLLAWWAAAGFLVTRWLSGRMALASMIGLAALPLAYGGFSILHAGEALATPRLFAEAAGLAALGMVLDRRWLAAVGFWLLAMAVHPIMGLAAGGVGLIVLLLDDRRWWWLVGCGLLILFVAVSLHAPVIDRLAAPLDPTWRLMLVQRCPFLFPRLWPNKDWGFLACQFAILALAIPEVPPRVRKLIAAATIVGVTGLLAATFSNSLLIIQGQVWRAQWLVAVLCAILFVPTMAGLIRRGGGAATCAAMVALAWVVRDDPLAVFALLAGAVVARALHLSDRFARLLAIGVWTIAGIVAVALTWRRAEVFLHASLSLPSALSLSHTALLRPEVHSLVIVTLAVLIAIGGLKRRSRWAFWISATATAALATMSILLWDSRPTVVKFRETADGARALRTALPREPVYWLDRPAAVWMWLRREEWWSESQGSSAVFDRTLAMEWARRRALLVAAGVLPMDQGWLSKAPPAAVKPLKAEMLRAVCAIPGGPAVLIAPAWRFDPSAAPLITARWQAPDVEYQFARGYWRWAAVRDYAAVDCKDIQQ